MTPEQIDAVTLLVEECRRFAYGYTKTTDARTTIKNRLTQVEAVVPLRRQGLDGKWLPVKED